MTLSLHSHYTPSMMSAEELEALLVKREDVVAEIMDSIRSSARTGSKRHTLIIGPRGSGKTHLISLIYHRVSANQALSKRLRVAWLVEDEWGVTSFLDLLLRVFRALLERYPDKDLDTRLDALRGQSRARAEREAADILAAYAEKHTVLILVENLDDLFQGMGDDGQRRLRAFLQEHPRFILTGTSQGLFAGISRQKAPFFGFFSVIHLEPFTVNDAVELLIRLARRRGDNELGDFLATPLGRARVRAIHHLAGGSPRIYVIFSYFISRKGLDELIPAFMRTLDDLTPYYQARMAWLPHQQRKIVEFLTTKRGAVPVKEIASHLFLSHQVAAAQLKQLRDANYVMAEAVGRESYYDLKEPLMGLALNVKRSRGEPIQLFVEFLRVWYTPTELEEQLVQLPADQPDLLIERNYLERAIEYRHNRKRDPRVEACTADLLEAFYRQDYHTVLSTAEELVALTDKATAYILLANAYTLLNRPEAALEPLQKAIHLSSNEATTLSLAAVCYSNLEMHETAFSISTRALEIDNNNVMSLITQGSLALKQNDFETAQIVLERAINLEEVPEQAFFLLGQTLEQLGKDKEALAVYNKGLRHYQASTILLEYKIRILVQQRDYAGTLRAANKLTQLLPTYDQAWAVKAAAHRDLGQWDAAIESSREAIKFSSNNSSYWLQLSNLLSFEGNYDEAREALEHALVLTPDDPFARFRSGIFTFHQGDWNEALTKLASALERFRELGQELPSPVEVLEAMFTAPPKPGWSREAIRDWFFQLLQLYRKHNASELLPKALLSYISELVHDTPPLQVLDTIMNAWHYIASDHPEFAVPLRLAQTALDYLNSSDRRILLALPVEERAIVEEILAQGKQKKRGGTKKRTNTRD